MERAMANIVNTMAQEGHFNTLLSALRTARQVGAISGTGPFPIFAPTDRAFARLPAGIHGGKEPMRRFFVYRACTTALW